MDRRQREVVRLLRKLGVAFELHTNSPKHPKFTVTHEGRSKTFTMSCSPSDVTGVLFVIRRDVIRFMKESQ